MLAVHDALREVGLAVLPLLLADTAPAAHVTIDISLDSASGGAMLVRAQGRQRRRTMPGASKPGRRDHLGGGVKMMVRRIGLTAALTLGMLALSTTAYAVPLFEDETLPIVGCEDGTENLNVVPRGAIGFVLDEDGSPTGEKLFIVSIDAALLADDGTLLGTFHQEYGNRTGHGAQMSCSGSIDEGDATGVFDMVVTRR